MSKINKKVTFKCLLNVYFFIGSFIVKLAPLMSLFFAVIVPLQLSSMIVLDIESPRPVEFNEDFVVKYELNILFKW